jgi:alkylhydroperoxidase/carboxymuconolactone decarboxylase family protein YurZ/quercetin dioxygenase-like cupin family protein
VKTTFAFAVAVLLPLAALAQTPEFQELPAMTQPALSSLDTAIARIGAAIARGEQDKLAAAFADAFDSGLTLAQAKELVGQLYAYCGFPRALNAAATLMEVSSHRGTETQSGNSGATPETPNPKPNASFLLGEKALEIGTANQTKLCGAPVAGPLFDFHPQLDQYLKAHLFGDIFARDALDWRTRELVTVAALAARPETEPQMKAHVAIANRNGVTSAQTDAILALVRRPADPADLPADWSPIPVGEPNDAYARYFTGRSYLHKLTLDQVPAFGVTFEPACRNNWHVHHAETGGGQILVCTAGRGYYQEWGKPAVEMTPGTTVNIPAGVKHWHGAAPDSWFQHIALEVPGTGGRNEWLEPVTDEAYFAATR